MIGWVLIEEGHVWTVIIIFGNILQRLTTVKELAQYIHFSLITENI